MCTHAQWAGCNWSVRVMCCWLVMMPQWHIISKNSFWKTILSKCPLFPVRFSQTSTLYEMIFAYNTVMSVLGIEDMWVPHDHQLVYDKQWWQKTSLMCWWSHISQAMYSAVTNPLPYKHTDWPPFAVPCMKNNKQAECVCVCVCVCVTVCIIVLYITAYCT